MEVLEVNILNVQNQTKILNLCADFLQPKKAKLNEFLFSVFITLFFPKNNFVII